MGSSHCDGATNEWSAAWTSLVGLPPSQSTSGEFAAALFREPAPPWVSSPSALAVMGARIPWICHIQLVPSSAFRTLSTAYFSHGPPALFHAGGTRGVSLGPMRSTRWLSLADLLCPNFPLQGSLPWTMEFCDEPLLLLDSSQRQTAAPAPASPRGVFLIPLGGV